MKKTILLLILIIFLTGCAKQREEFGTEPQEAEKLPPIQANFVDLNYIKEISVFRSCEGHVKMSANEEEPVSNMNHYFYIKDTYWEQKTQIPIYSPYNGFVSIGDRENVYVTPWEVKNIMNMDDKWFFEITDIIQVEGLKSGPIKAGDVIAYYNPDQGNQFDIITGLRSTSPKTIHDYVSPYKEMDSIFNYMPDNVFAEYQARGIQSRESMISSREYRFSHPCEYEELNSINFKKSKWNDGIVGLN